MSRQREQRQSNKQVAASLPKMFSMSSSEEGETTAPTAPRNGAAAAAAAGGDAPQSKARQRVATTEVRNRFGSLPSDQCVSQAPTSSCGGGSGIGPGSSGSGGGNNGNAHEAPDNFAQQKYDLILVLDFEATCERDVSTYPHEIIEFPVVVVDVQTRQAVGEFHTYVRPVINPRLTEFCTELTGITQKQVDEAPTLPEVLQLFRAWLQQFLQLRKDMRDKAAASSSEGTAAAAASSSSSSAVANNKQRDRGGRCGLSERVVLATDGPWDVRNFLFGHHMQRDGTAVPAVLLSFLNVRAEYAQHFKCRPMKLVQALARQGMSFQGHEHSGIADTRNIARLVTLLLRRGHVFAAPSRVFGSAKDFKSLKLAYSLLGDDLLPRAVGGQAGAQSEELRAVVPLARALAGCFAMEADKEMVKSELGFGDTSAAALSALAAEIDAARSSKRKKKPAADAPAMDATAQRWRLQHVPGPKPAAKPAAAAVQKPPHKPHVPRDLDSDDDGHGDDDGDDGADDLE